MQNYVEHKLWVNRTFPIIPTQGGSCYRNYILAIFWYFLWPNFCPFGGLRLKIKFKNIASNCFQFQLLNLSVMKNWNIRSATKYKHFKATTPARIYLNIIFLPSAWKAKGCLIFSFSFSSWGHLSQRCSTVSVPHEIPHPFSVHTSKFLHLHLSILHSYIYQVKSKKNIGNFTNSQISKNQKFGKLNFFRKFKTFKK